MQPCRVQHPYQLNPSTNWVPYPGSCTNCPVLQIVHTQIDSSTKEPFWHNRVHHLALTFSKRSCFPPCLLCIMPRFLYYLVQSHMFELCIMVLIIANALLMATTYYGQVGLSWRSMLP